MTHSLPPKPSTAVIKFIRTLHHKRDRSQHRKFLLEGLRLVESARLLAYPLEQVFFTPALRATPRGAALLDALPKDSALEVSETVMARLCTTATPQGILAVAAQRHYDWPQLLHSGPPILVLDGIADPGNLGAIFRTAWAAGASLVLTGNPVEVYNPKVVRASMGGVCRVPFVTGAACGEVEARLAAAGYRLYLTRAHARSGYWQEKFPPRCAWVLGSEAHGLTPASWSGALELAIPMSPGTESLNVGTCAGILLYEYLRQIDTGNTCRVKSNGNPAL